jgi:hypothetical protein
MIWLALIVFLFVFVVGVIALVFLLAVGEDDGRRGGYLLGERKWTRPEWEAAYDQALKTRDWQTCELLMFERPHAWGPRS